MGEAWSICMHGVVDADDVYMVWDLGNCIYTFYLLSISEVELRAAQI